MLNPLLYCHMYDILAQNCKCGGVFTRARRNSPEINNIVLHAANLAKRTAARKETPMFTPQQIEEVSFNRARFGGYDIASVDAFLEPLTNDYIALYKENNLLKNKMRVLVEKMEELRKGDSGSRDAISSTKKTCDSMLRETEARCAKMLADAQAAADKLAADTVAKHPAASIAAIQDQLNSAVAALDLWQVDEGALARYYEKAAKFFAGLDALVQVKQAEDSQW